MGAAKSTRPSFDVIEIAGYWRVMRAGKLICTRKTKRSAQAAARRLAKAEGRS